jgi:hypothetical protein
MSIGDRLRNHENSHKSFPTIFLKKLFARCQKATLKENKENKVNQKKRTNIIKKDIKVQIDDAY